MSVASAALLVLLGSLAGVVGWRQSTRRIYRRSLYEPDPPAGVSRADYERRRRRRRKIWRLYITALYVVLGVLAGLLVMALLDRR